MGDTKMDRRLRIARLLLTLPAAFIVVGPPVADLNESHLLNELWTGHARLHTAWLISSNALVSLVALVLMWRERLLGLAVGVRLAAVLVGCVLVGFMVAAATQPFYDGALADAGVGITIAGLDANLTVFGLLLCVVGVAAYLGRPSGARSGGGR